MNDQDQWSTVSEESPTKIVFDTIGDVFTGTFKGKLHIEPPDGEDPFDVLTFRDDAGEFCSMGGYKLMQAFEEIPRETYCRITYVKNVDTGQPSPMKDFRVETRS